MMSNSEWQDIIFIHNGATGTKLRVGESEQSARAWLDAEGYAFRYTSVSVDWKAHVRVITIAVYKLDKQEECYDVEFAE